MLWWFPALSYLVSASAESLPLQDLMPTLTSNGIYIVRIATTKEPAESHAKEDQGTLSMTAGPEVDVLIRQVEGTELMNVLGLASSYLHTAMPDHDLCTDFAGNAFSGFCVLPVLLSLLSTVVPDSTPATVVATQLTFDDESESD